ncbi:serpin-ZX [Trifolium medium]|uniref:Serpin-ZX n=1 Tax=Trifolium medium TaxID=97028 RepID=A0A392LZG9_9FABA|nr:serpin-ZX [Trifolium medium]
MTITKHLLSKPEYKERNIVISPLSLQTVLSITAAGSKDPTQRQLLSFLGSESITNLNSLSSHLVSSVLSDAAHFGGPRLTFANSVWVERSLSLYPSFKDTIATDYMATLASLDFTNKEHGINNSSVKVPFMTSNEMHFVSTFDGFKVLRLPYEQGEDDRQFSMYFFLPNAKDGLLDLIEKVASEFEFLEDNLAYKKVEVGDFMIPCFKMSFGIEASDALKELGVVLLFFGGGLTKMVDSPIWISNIFQKSFIEVNEKGTEAAAATIVECLGCCRATLKPIPIYFVADHPFLFFIREDFSGTILFFGQVFNPLDG